MDASSAWEKVSVIESPCRVLTLAPEIVAGLVSSTSTVKLDVWLSGGEPLSVTTTLNG